MARCSICKKRAKSGSNVSHAQNRTKRKFRPNLQKVNGILLCSKCIKTIKKINREELAKVEEKKIAEVESSDAPKKSEVGVPTESVGKKEVKKPKKETAKKAPAKKKTTAKK